MKKMVLMFVLLSVVLAFAACQKEAAKLSYPVTKKVDQVDDYFGTKVADPYRWLEDDKSAETGAMGRGPKRRDLRLPREDPLPRRASRSG